MADADVAALAESWPRDGFLVNHRESGSDKTYRIAIRSLVAPGQGPCETVATLPAVWQRLVADVVSTSYREIVAGLTGIDLRTAVVEVLLNEYHGGYWLSPHTDKHPKLVTQLFYFNDGWRAEWGGALEILDGPDAVAASVLPDRGVSTLIVRSERSWHAVQPVQPGVPERRSLQVVFWAEVPSPHPAGRVVAGY
jgi:SM-20-related protein